MYTTYSLTAADLIICGFNNYGINIYIYVGAYACDWLQPWIAYKTIGIGSRKLLFLDHRIITINIVLCNKVNGLNLEESIDVCEMWSSRLV